MLANVQITGFRSDIALWWGLLLLLLSVGVAYWHYRATNPPTSLFVRRTLGVARVAALVAALLMLSSPAIQWVSVRKATPELLVLEDASLSMRRVEGGIARWERSAAVLEQLRGALRGRVRVRAFGFGSRLRVLREGLQDSSQVVDQSTDISAALRATEDSLVSGRTIGLVVVSDGAYNRGADPAAGAGELGVPVWGVCVGDSAAPKDVAIAGAEVPEVASVGKPAQLDVRLRISGFREPQKVKLVVRTQTGKVAAAKVIELAPGELEKTVGLTVTPEDTGLVRLSVLAETVPGEVSRRNNRADVYIRVLPRVRRILLLAGSPNADFGFLRRELEMDSAFAVTAAYEIRPGRLSRSLPDSLLRSVEGAILVNFPARWTWPRLRERVLGTLKRIGKPLLVFAQAGFDWSGFRAFYPGVVPQKLRSLPEQAVSVSLSKRAALHPLVRLSDYREQTEEAWAGVAPVAACWLVRGIPDSCVALLNAKAASGSALNLGWALENRNAKLAVFAMAGFWRWRLAPVAYDREPQLYRVFVKNIGEWLVAPKHVHGFEVKPERRVFEGGEPVVFRARVLDLGFRPVENAVVSVKIRNKAGDGEQTLLLGGAGGGLYRGEVVALPAGVYEYQGTAQAGDRVWKGARGTFAVKPFVAELSDLRSRPDVLRRLAAATGGGFCVSEGEVQELIQALQEKVGEFEAKDIREERPGSWSAKASWWILGVLIIALGMEWTVRRRQGLL